MLSKRKTMKSEYSMNKLLRWIIFQDNSKDLAIKWDVYLDKIKVFIIKFVKVNKNLDYQLTKQINSEEN